jgi:hypothetical protein
MTQLRRLIAISILMVSLFGVALADGGATQGPPLAPPAPPAECTTGCSETAYTQAQPTQDSSVDFVTEATTRFAAWLEAMIF